MSPLSDLPASVLLDTKGSPGSILVVDDENELRRLLVRILESEGFQVTQTGNALEALGILKKKRRLLFAGGTERV